MSDDQDRAEMLDDEKLADDEPRPDPERFVELPAEEFPPEEPMGVASDEATGISDDLATRAEREEPDDDAGRRGEALP